MHKSTEKFNQFPSEHPLQYFHFPPSTPLSWLLGPTLDGRSSAFNTMTHPPFSHTPSSTRLANIPKQAVEEATDSPSGRIFPEVDDKRILNTLRHVWKDVQKVLEQDPKLKKYLASMEEFRDNVTKKGEKSFIDSLRAMATNSESQGSDAWKDSLEDGT